MSYCRGHDGQRIGKSVKVFRNGKIVCSICNRGLPPGTWALTGVVQESGGVAHD